ncbi:MAG: type II toxin-antitoxin system VapC family toxin [Armatimonadetes bacterium]|nr:type II toxin-antitoxin system VapC family toxin [Armatimonadota bacterium]
MLTGIGLKGREKMTRKGCDTSFFRALMNGHPDAVSIWREAVHSKLLLVVSTITVNELLTLYYRHGESETGRRIIARLIKAAWVRLIPVSIQIAFRSAGYRHGLGLSTVDAIILATVVEEGCDEILTTDRHFIIAENQGVIKVNLMR